MIKCVAFQVNAFDDFLYQQLRYDIEAMLLYAKLQCIPLEAITY